MRAGLALPAVRAIRELADQPVVPGVRLVRWGIRFPEGQGGLLPPEGPEEQGVTLGTQAAGQLLITEDRLTIVMAAVQAMEVPVGAGQGGRDLPATIPPLVPAGVLGAAGRVPLIPAVLLRSM